MQDTRPKRTPTEQKLPPSMCKEDWHAALTFMESLPSECVQVLSKLRFSFLPIQLETVLKVSSLKRSSPSLLQKTVFVTHNRWYEMEALSVDFTYKLSADKDVRSC